MSDFVIEHSVMVLEDGREVHTLADADEHRCQLVHMWAKDCPSCARDRLAAELAEVKRERDSLREKLAAAEALIDEMKGVIGLPAKVDLARHGLTDSLPDRIRYAMREWLEQTHSAQQRVITEEMRADHAEAALREATEWRPMETAPVRSLAMVLTAANQVYIASRETDASLWMTVGDRVILGKKRGWLPLPAPPKDGEK